MGARRSFYDSLIAITEDYLGPAAPRFLSRIAQSHLDKPATKLTKSDLPEVIIWVELAANILTDNMHEIEEYTRRLKALAPKPDVTHKTAHKA